VRVSAQDSKPSSRGDLWTNIPVSEPFAQQSPYVLERVDGNYVIHRDGKPVAPITLAPLPNWYERRTTSGKPMRTVGTLQGTYLGVYPAKVCEYWVKGPERPERTNCKFCSVGLNLGIDDADGKAVDEVVEVAPRGVARIRHHVRRLQHRPLRRSHVPRLPRAVHPRDQAGDRSVDRCADAAASPTSRATTD
jgi:hypothetical protein